MKIALDLGHGQGIYDGGAVGIITEESLIDSICPIVQEKLTSLGHTVILTRPKKAINTSDALSQRCKTANNVNADLFVSIHANVTPGGRGTEVFTFNGKSTQRASNVLNNICALGFVNRGIKDGSGLYVIRNTNMEAMLIEVCFVDNQDDVARYKNNIENIAKAIVEGITNQKIEDSCMKQTVLNEKTTSEQPNLNTQKTTNLFKIQIGAFTDEKNADEMIDRLKKLGIDAFKITQ